MPHSWVDFYKTGFEAVSRVFNCDVTHSDIEKSVEILKGFNPRVNYREEEYSPEYIFAVSTKHWANPPDPNRCASVFYEGLHLKVRIFPDTIPTLTRLREEGYRTAALTDLPTAMPDDFFKRGIGEITDHINLYVSSLSCGFRKPNPGGIRVVSEHFGIPVTDILFVGDEEKDKKTAENAGCGFVRINRKVKADSSIFDLTELSLIL